MGPGNDLTFRPWRGAVWVDWRAAFAQSDSGPSDRSFTDKVKTEPVWSNVEAVRRVPCRLRKRQLCDRHHIIEPTRRLGLARCGATSVSAPPI